MVGALEHNPRTQLMFIQRFIASVSTSIFRLVNFRTVPKQQSSENHAHTMKNIPTSTIVEGRSSEQGFQAYLQTAEMFKVIMSLLAHAAAPANQHASTPMVMYEAQSYRRDFTNESLEKHTKVSEVLQLDGRPSRYVMRLRHDLSELLCVLRII